MEQFGGTGKRRHRLCHLDLEIQTNDDEHGALGAFGEWRGWFHRRSPTVGLAKRRGRDEAPGLRCRSGDGRSAALRTCTRDPSRTPFWSNTRRNRSTIFRPACLKPNWRLASCAASRGSMPEPALRKCAGAAPSSSDAIRHGLRSERGKVVVPVSSLGGFLTGSLAKAVGVGFQRPRCTASRAPSLICFRGRALECATPAASRIRSVASSRRIGRSAVAMRPIRSAKGAPTNDFAVSIWQGARRGLVIG